MKKLFYLSALFLLINFYSYSQSPQSFRYQAIARNAVGEVLPGQAVSFRVGILQGSATGTTVYSEEHTAVTNSFGLVNLGIGTGSNPTDTFALINWSAGPYFIKIESDITGGTNYSVMGTSQLLSVPYALFAASGNPGPQGPQGIQGSPGADGSNGQDGVGIINTYVQDDSLYIRLSNGDTLNAGHVTGLQGPQGLQGVGGNDGISVSGTYIQNDSLIITLTNSQVINAGHVTGQQGSQGLQGLQGPAGIYTAGTGITISGDTVYNTQPDQAVTLQGAGATTVSGSYPDFTIMSTDSNTTYQAGAGLSLNGTTFNSTWTASGNDIFNNNFGNVGIGTNTPLATLDVMGTIRYDDGGAISSGKVLTSDASGYVNWQSPAIGSANGTQNYIAKFSGASSLGNSLFYESGPNIGLGTTTPGGRFVVMGDSLTPDTVPLFEVKDKTGSTVFVVWPEGAHIYVKNSSGMAKSANRGSFAVSGKSSNKANGVIDYFNIQPDSVPQIINPSEARVLWYPNKEALLIGKVLVESPDSIGTNSFASGFESKAIGSWSQALGYHSVARSNYATAIGKNAVANSLNSFAFGDGAKALNQDAYAIGAYSQAEGTGSFAFGFVGRDSLGPTGIITKATGDYSFAFGLGSQSLAEGAIAFGANDSATAPFSFSMGYKTKASGWYAVSMGYNTTASGTGSTAMGSASIAGGINSIAMGNYARATNMNSIAFGLYTLASGPYSTAMGRLTTASGYYSTTMGFGTVASGDNSFAHGSYSTASGNFSFAVGNQTNASGTDAFALGRQTSASNSSATALGYMTTASGAYATAIGNTTVASGVSSVAMGNGTLARSNVTTAMGYQTTAYGVYSTAAGNNTNAKSYNSFAIGRYNDTTSSSSSAWVASDPLFIIGNGSSAVSRSNAMLVLKNGETFLPGVYAATVGATNRDLYIDNTGKIGYVSSSKKYKENIIDMEDISWIYKLRPVNYNYKTDVLKNKEYGLIAEEVEKINSLFVSYDSKGNIETVNYSRFITPMLKAIQDQQKIITKLQNEINSKNQDINNIKAELDNIKSVIGTSLK